MRLDAADDLVPLDLLEADVNRHQQHRNLFQSTTAVVQAAARGVCCVMLCKAPDAAHALIYMVLPDEVF